MVLQIQRDFVGQRSDTNGSWTRSVEISPTKADKRRVSCRPAEATRPGSAVFAALGSTFSTWVIFFVNYPLVQQLSLGIHRLPPPFVITVREQIPLQPIPAIRVCQINHRIYIDYIITSSITLLCRLRK